MIVKLGQFQVDMVIHFAAITHVDESYTDRVGTIQDNIISTTTLLESIVNRKYTGVKKLVHISTGKKYNNNGIFQKVKLTKEGNEEHKKIKYSLIFFSDEIYGDSFDDATPKNENSLPNPTNPYAASKAACEVIIRSYWHSYKLPYVMVRMNNVYGPRQAYTKLIPKFTKFALDGKPYPLMGDGLHTRSWMYVADCSEAIRRVAEEGKLGEVYNIGTDFEMTNIELTRKIHAIVNKLQQRYVHIPHPCH
uniref:NAD(P)-bd_dom domain-containing protein n=1 Tax=Heterorhabditis bacteriophora TaxID=37862 RepID=A0A1I7WQT2_HETBA